MFKARKKQHSLADHRNADLTLQISNTTKARPPSLMSTLAEHCPSDALKILEKLILKESDSPKEKSPTIELLSKRLPIIKK